MIRLLHALTFCMILGGLTPAGLAQVPVSAPAPAPAPAPASAPASGNAAGASEERVKAAFLLRFIGYVEWPASAFARPDSPYIVGVLDADYIANELAALSAGRMLGSRPVMIKRLQGRDSLSGLHALFIGAAGAGRLAQSIRSVPQQPTLVVTESEGALSAGTMINFRIVDNRVRFDVALEPAERSGLKINSRMLGVALSVIKGQPQQ